MWCQMQRTARAPVTPETRRSMNRFRPGACRGSTALLTPGFPTPDFLFRAAGNFGAHCSPILRVLASVAYVCRHRKSSSIIHAHSQHIFSPHFIENFQGLSKRKKERNLFHSLPVFISRMPEQQNATASWLPFHPHPPPRFLSELADSKLKSIY